MSLCEKLLPSAFLSLYALSASAQPFRYISGEDSQRDSIRIFGIRGYTEYSATYEDSNKRTTTSIIEYDRQGNMTRNYRHDLVAGWENQYTWKYDEKNQLIEEASYSPDTMTLLQRFNHCYDVRGNKIEDVSENFSQGAFTGNSRVLYAYDQSNHLTSLKVYSNKGLHTHYEYTYNENGVRLEELMYSPEGKLLWRRPSHSDYQEGETYGFPPDPDPELEALMKVTVTFDHTTGNTTYTDGYGKRIFNSKGLLIYWYEGHFRHHWYHYDFYE